MMDTSQMIPSKDVILMLSKLLGNSFIRFFLIFPLNFSKKESFQQIDISDFEFLKLISKGAFGRVWLVKKVNTENFYAMKIVNLAEKVRQ